jgi:hypothetical protein
MEHIMNEIAKLKEKIEQLKEDMKEDFLCKK